MSTHIYAFGSVCRGEVAHDSDVDLLAIVDGQDDRFDPEVYSIYSPSRIRTLWAEGNPFAWHLALEARLLFTTEPTDFLAGLGKPDRYLKCGEDSEKFSRLFEEAHESLLSNDSSSVFDLSMVFLSIRNIATCYSLGMSSEPTFSRRSALELGSDSVPLTEQSYEILKRARVLCTRGHGSKITKNEAHVVVNELIAVKEWMITLIRRTHENERIQ